MDYNLDFIDDTDEEIEATRVSAQEVFNNWMGELKFLKSQYPKEYRFCFNNQREIDDLVYSYLNEEYQKLLHH